MIPCAVGACCPCAASRARPTLDWETNRSFFIFSIKPEKKRAALLAADKREEKTNPKGHAPFCTHQGQMKKWAFFFI